MPDVVRQESYEAVEGLQEQGIEGVMLIGDSPAVTASVAEELGLRQYLAGDLPEANADTITPSEVQGYRVAMVVMGQTMPLPMWGWPSLPGRTLP